MGLRKISKIQTASTKEITLRRNETFMKVAGRLLKEYEANPNPTLLLEAQKLLEFVVEDMHFRNTESNNNR